MFVCRANQGSKNKSRFTIGVAFFALQRQLAGIVVIGQLPTLSKCDRDWVAQPVVYLV